jgi:hypothetical protein
MDRLKKFLFPKSLSDIFVALSLIASVCALTGYLKTGVTIFNPVLEKAVIITAGIGIGLNFIFLVFNSKIGKYSCYLIMLFSFIEYLSSQITYVANIFVAIDGSTFSAGFIFTCVSFILAWVLDLTGAILADDEVDVWNGKEKNHVQSVK